MLPRQGKAKGVHHQQTIITGNVKGTYLRKKKKIKTMNLKRQQIHNYQQLNLKNKQTNKQKLSKEPEQEQNHRYGEHLEGYQLGMGRERMGKW